MKDKEWKSLKEFAKKFFKITLHPYHRMWLENDIEKQQRWTKEDLEAYCKSLSGPGPITGSHINEAHEKAIDASNIKLMKYWIQYLVNKAMSGNKSLTIIWADDEPKKEEPQQDSRYCDHQRVKIPRRLALDKLLLRVNEDTAFKETARYKYWYHCYKCSTTFGTEKTIPPGYL